MIQSMTGYGKTSFELGNKKTAIEIKTLNSKQLDITCKLSASYRSKEIEIRNKIAQLLRGKIDFCMYDEKDEKNITTLVNKDVILSYYTSLSEIADELDISKNHLLSSILRFPEVMAGISAELSEQEWDIIFEKIKETLSEVKNFRLHEGQLLCDDILMRIEIIRKKTIELEQYEPERIEKAKERLKKQLSELESKQFDNNRFEQELIYYFEKLDITEEKIRLNKHLDYFIDTVKQPESQGKKLGFIGQEIGREINTIGSKSNHADMQKIVVQIKDELEKIKEQLGNIL